jgi:hypothetical protein
MSIYEAVEKFHMAFLRHFAPAVSAGKVCLKGGVNLRLFHGSPRPSEDMDFDARRVVGVEILRKNVSKVLDSRPLRTGLAAAGIGSVAIAPRNLAQTQMFLISSLSSLRLGAP